MHEVRSGDACVAHRPNCLSLSDPMGRHYNESCFLDTLDAGECGEHTGIAPHLTTALGGGGSTSLSIISFVTFTLR